MKDVDAEGAPFGSQQRAQLDFVEASVPYLPRRMCLVTGGSLISLSTMSKSSNGADWLIESVVFLPRNIAAVLGSMLTIAAASPIQEPRE